MLSIRRLFERSSMNRPTRVSAVRARPTLESLEARVVLYTATGNAWPHPQVVTISFVPDGTNMAGVPSNLFSKFNANPKLTGKWQAQILKAAQLWGQQTNINFVVVPDNGVPEGSGSYQQGDPGSGDIRISGYAFGSSTLAVSYQPPPVNNFDMAGDISFNTSSPWAIGSSGYDLATVATHEIGHALGLGHSSTSPANQMLPSYNAMKTALSPDDIAGIQSVYGGARKQDAYDAVSSNGTFATATDLTGSIDPTSLAAVVNNLDITTTSDVDTYVFTAPTGTSGTLQLNVQSSGLSLLSPKVTVYAADQTTVLGSASGLNQDGTTLSVSVSGVTAGQVIYVKVQGADTTPFSTGAYALTLNLGSGATPTVPLPSTATPNGNPISAGGGIADSVRGHGHDNKHVDSLPATSIHGFPIGPDRFATKGHHRHHHHKV